MASVKRSNRGGLSGHRPASASPVPISVFECPKKAALVDSLLRKALRQERRNKKP